jgi:drug/metabolite transporter (DMT)-like permease
MIYLFLSIFFSTLILVVFRLFTRFKVNTFQAIVFNYIVAFSVGFGLYGSVWKNEYITEGAWLPFALVIGVLFISLFLIMGKSAQENGIGITSVTVKMSLAIPVLAAIYIYAEDVYLAKILGVIAALVGVFLITFQKKSEKKAKNGNYWFLIVLFLGSGALDTLLNYVEKRALGDLSPALFSAIGFGIAGIIGLFVLAIALALGKQKLKWKNILAGIILGIPNYFSIYFLIMAIREPMDDSITYALNNVGIVMASFALGIVFFNESVTRLKLIGGIIAIAAILLLMV